MLRLRSLVPLLACLVCWTGCQPSPDRSSSASAGRTSPDPAPSAYATMPLDADLSTLSAEHRTTTPHFIEAAQTMDAVFWEQAYGNRDSLLQAVAASERRDRVRHNYGPWDRTRSVASFVPEAGPRPPGANLYPVGLTQDAIADAAARDTLRHPHTVVRRLPDGSLTALPYHLFFAEGHSTAALHLRDAARVAPSAAQRQVLTRHAEGLSNGMYGPADRAWHALDGPTVDVLLGPMETGEDRLLGVKATAAAAVLRRTDEEGRPEALADRLAERWASLPVPEALRATAPARPARWQAYDLLYAAGGLNAGPKSAVLPPRAGTLEGETPRRLLLSNVLRAQVDSLLRPSAAALLVAPQRDRVTTEAAASTAMLRAEAHRFVPAPSTPIGAPAVRATAAADALGLQFALSLADASAVQTDSLALAATAVTRLAHRVRVDSTNTPGRAAALLLRRFEEAGALGVGASGAFRVHLDPLGATLPGLVDRLLSGRTEPLPSAPVPEALRAALDRLDAADVPRALAFEQGPSVLRGLSPATAAR